MPSPKALVIQASFAPGKEPRAPKPAAPEGKPVPAPATRAPAAKTEKSTRAATAATRAPHPATVTQKKEAPSPAKRPPHPAAGGVAQKKEAPAAKERPPHPAAGGVAQKKRVPAAQERPPHPATLARGRKAAQAVTAGVAQGAFAAPPGLLRMGSMARGKPLPATVQRAMEERFGGADFAEVRVHEGPEAAAIGALALTAGDHLFFAPGQYRPETKSGGALLGKQLAYVLQQREGRVTNPFGSGLAVVQDPALEADANARAGIARR